jgi:chemotaxis protein MotB
MAARRHQQEEHVNHEAWAIPYGDLVTLLLAFFVVMYAISSVNAGKYRVLADALSSAFGGPPRTVAPIQLGEAQLRGAAFDRPSMQTSGAKGPTAAVPVQVRQVRQVLDMPTFGMKHANASASAAETAGRARRQLAALGRRIQNALAELVRRGLVSVRRGNNFLEVEIQSDILFASGVAEPSAQAQATVRLVADVLRDAPNALRVEGYTDDRPIHSARFPSNWELSAARALGVTRVLIDAGVAPERLAAVGYGQYQPIADNATEDGRNANRRVLLVILASPQGPDAIEDRFTPIAGQDDADDGGAAPIAAEADAAGAEHAPSIASEPGTDDADTAPQPLTVAHAVADGDDGAEPGAG